MDDMELFNYMDSLQIQQEDLTLNVCECGIKIIDVCKMCGYSVNNLVFETGVSFSASKNYNIKKACVYNKYNYMKVYLYKLKEIDKLVYEDKVYNMVLDKYYTNKDNFKITFRSFFFRIRGIFQEDELNQFLYYRNKHKIDMKKVKEILTYDMIHRISIGYKLAHCNVKRKWCNRNSFIRYFFKDVYESVKDFIFLTDETLIKYQGYL